MGPDFRVLVRKARKTAQTYFRLYHEHIPVAQLVRETAAVMQEFTRKWSFRRLPICITLQLLRRSSVRAVVRSDGCHAAIQR